MTTTWVEEMAMFSDNGKQAVLDHVELASRLHTFFSLTSMLIEQIHERKCTRSSGRSKGTYVPATPRMAVIYDDLIYWGKSRTQYTDICPSMHCTAEDLMFRQLDDLGENPSGLFTHVYYDGGLSIPDEYSTTLYNDAKQWQLSSDKLELTSDDISIFLDYRTIYIELVNDYWAHIKNDLSGARSDEIVECQKEYKKLLKLFNRSKLLSALGCELYVGH